MGKWGLGYWGEGAVGVKEEPMTLNEIITRAASVYPECWVLQYWDMKRQCAVENRDGGDTLAEFVALELYQTFDPEASDGQQLDMAIPIPLNPFPS